MPRPVALAIGYPAARAATLMRAYPISLPWAIGNYAWTLAPRAAETAERPAARVGLSARARTGRQRTPRARRVWFLAVTASDRVSRCGSVLARLHAYASGGGGGGFLTPAHAMQRVHVMEAPRASAGLDQTPMRALVTTPDGEGEASLAPSCVCGLVDILHMWIN